MLVGLLCVRGTSASEAQQRKLPRQVNVALTGGLTIAWAGDAAHGCAVVGVCGVRGSVAISLGESSTSSSGGPPTLEVSDDNAVARVQSTAPDGAVTACADLVPVDFYFAVRGVGSARRAMIDVPESLGLPSAGRCAGPIGADLSGLALPARPLGAHGYDMSGHSSFHSGPFAIIAVSTVRAHITYGAQRGGPLGGSFPGPQPVQSRTALEESASVVYRITRLSGALATDFAGLAPPLCDALGACGASGHLVQTFSARGTITFAGSRLVGRRVAPGVALADLRRGRLPLSQGFATSPITTSVSEMISEGDGTRCTDSAMTRSGQWEQRAQHAGDKLLLSANPGGFPGGVIDPFRTRCPGPSIADILGDGRATMASAGLASSRLGAQRLSVIMRNDGAFHGLDYRGRRSGTEVLSLSLVRRTGRTRRVRIFQGVPPFSPS